MTVVTHTNGDAEREVKEIVVVLLPNLLQEIIAYFLSLHVYRLADYNIPLEIMRDLYVRS